MDNTPQTISEAAALIRSARYLTAFTGAGISVESGIPPFRGAGGLWSKYDPRMLELDYFLSHPDKAWPVIKEIFYDHFGAARPNKAHLVLARLENEGWPRGTTSGGGEDSVRPDGPRDQASGSDAAAKPAPKPRNAARPKTAARAEAVRAPASVTDEPYRAEGRGPASDASGRLGAPQAPANTAPPEASFPRGYLQLLITQNVDSVW
jgi:hypothetical protein